MHPHEDDLGDVLGLVGAAREHEGPAGHNRTQCVEEPIDFPSSTDTGGVGKIIQVGIGHWDIRSAGLATGDGLPG